MAFWHRRQLHETLIHLWDLRTAGGLDLVVGPVLWADTVDEAVTVMHPRQVRLGRASAPPVRLGLAATDLDRTWSLSAAADAPAARAATLTGPAEALALLVWRRIGLDDPTALGGRRRGTRSRRCWPTASCPEARRVPSGHRTRRHEATVSAGTPAA